MEDENDRQGAAHGGSDRKPKEGRVIDQRQQQHDPARHDTADSNEADAEGSTKQPGLTREDLLRDLDDPVNEPGP